MSNQPQLGALGALAGLYNDDDMSEEDKEKEPLPLEEVKIKVEAEVKVQELTGKETEPVAVPLCSDPVAVPLCSELVAVPLCSEPVPLCSDPIAVTLCSDLDIAKVNVEVQDLAGTETEPVPPSSDVDLDPHSSSNANFTKFRNQDDVNNDETEDSDLDSSSDSEQETNGLRVNILEVDVDDAVDSGSDEDYDLSSSLRGEESALNKEPPKVKGELSYGDLPPIQDLTISVPHDKAKPIGVIKSVVDPLVIVEAFPSTPALDLDSVLFLEEGDRALGRVFDVLGPVKQPWYAVRFNSLEHIQANGVVVGAQVYCAPATQHATFVLLAQLQMLKGSDASWKNDIEPPPEIQEFSDDEAEMRVKKKKRRKPRVHPHQFGYHEGGGMTRMQYPNYYQRQVNHEGMTRMPYQNRYQNPGQAYGGRGQHQQSQRYPSGQFPRPTSYAHQSDVTCNNDNSYMSYYQPQPEYSWHTHPAAAPAPFQSYNRQQQYQQQQYSGPAPWPHPLVQAQHWSRPPPPPPPLPSIPQRPRAYLPQPPGT